jgi:glucosamine--fructose-6-phosphate aminotransferase (isomerizing)
MKHFVADTETVLEQLSKVDFKTIATEMINTSLFVLGTGVNVPVANEGALKIKELSYIHAEGYSYSSLKHGPLALIDRGTPAIFLISNKNHTHKLNNSMMEVKSRLGRTFVIGNQEDADVPILSDNHFAFLWNNIAVQMIAFNIALAKGNDPDMPRNLAKVVTVL